MTDDRDQDCTAFLAAVARAIDFGGEPASVDPREAFAAVCGHVMVLLADAVEAHGRGSAGTATFLALTALEETAKAEILLFRRSRTSGRGKGRDPLRDHRTKHAIAVRPTTFMGRLRGVLGPEACDRLRREAEDGGLVRLRERALYVHIDVGRVATPASEVGRERSREILLLALEAADDVLVGWTDASHDLVEPIEAWITLLSSGTRGGAA